ncbi:MAG: hypothetical protein ACE5I1_00970 [bacterium]
MSRIDLFIDATLWQRFPFTPHSRFFSLLSVIVFCSHLLAQSPQPYQSSAPSFVSKSAIHNHNQLLEEVEAFVKIPAVVGRELHAAEFIKNQLGSLPVKQDAHGSLTLTIGTGEPKRLIACQLDEPGYVVTHIQDDGYLRLNRVGRGQMGALWDQFHEGQKIVIATADGLVPGAIGVRSTHLRRGRRDTNLTPRRLVDEILRLVDLMVAIVKE